MYGVDENNYEIENEERYITSYSKKQKEDTGKTPSPLDDSDKNQEAKVRNNDTILSSAFLEGLDAEQDEGMFQTRPKGEENSQIIVKDEQNFAENTYIHGAFDSYLDLSHNKRRLPGLPEESSFSEIQSSDVNSISLNLT